MESSTRQQQQQQRDITRASLEPLGHHCPRPRPLPLPLVDGGELDPLLQPVGHAQQLLVLEGGAQQLQTNGKPPRGQGDRHRDGGKAWGG